MKHKMITICIAVVKSLSSLVSVARSPLNLINEIEIEWAELFLEIEWAELD